MRKHDRQGEVSNQHEIAQTGILLGATPKVDRVLYKIELFVHIVYDINR